MGKQKLKIKIKEDSTPQEVCQEAIDWVIDNSDDAARVEEFKKFQESFKGAKSMVTKLSAKAYPGLTKLMAETSPKPVKHIRHKGHDFIVMKDEGGMFGKDKFSYTLDGETFSNEGKGYASIQDAMSAIKNYVQENKKAFQSVTAFLWANLPYPESVQDVANLLLCDKVASILEAGDLADEGIDDATKEELLNSVIRPGEDITQTIPEYFTQDDFGYHRYLPTQEASHMVELIDEALAGKLTFEGIWEHDSNLAARFILQMMGHGVGPLDDEDDAAWLEQNGVTHEIIDKIPHEESMDAFDSAHDLLLAWHDFKSEPPASAPAPKPEESEPNPNGPQEPPEEPELQDEEVAVEEKPPEEPEEP